MPGPSTPKPREWHEPYLPIVDDRGEFVAIDRERVKDALMEIEAFLYRFGGGAVIAAERVEHPDGTYETVGVRVTYHSFMPTVDRPDPELVPAEANGRIQQAAAAHAAEPGPPPASAEAGTEATLEPSTVE